MKNKQFTIKTLYIAIFAYIIATIIKLVEHFYNISLTDWLTLSLLLCCVIFELINILNRKK